MCLFVYTDGARQSGDGGWAFVAVLNGDEVHRDSGVLGRCTNNYAELFAILKALAWAQSYTPVDNVIIVTDSQYSINVITKDAPGYPNGPRGSSKNRELVMQCRTLVGARVKLQWVKGHSGIEWNEFADRLASQALRGKPASAVHKPRKAPRGTFTVIRSAPLPELPKRA